MARRKAVPPSRPPKQRAHKPPPHGGSPSDEAATRRFLNRGVQVEISEASDGVALRLDDVPIEVSRDGGEYFAHLAHMFTGFGSMDALVDHLLANEGRTWTLHGHVCGEHCRGGHHHGHGSDHSPHGGGHGPVTPDHSHEHGGGDHQHGEDHGHQPVPRQARKTPRGGGAR